MSTEKKSLFVTNDGKNLMFTFILVSSLFLLWGVCNGMIDVDGQAFPGRTALDLVAIGVGAVGALPGLLPDVHPAGWLATKLGYKGGIITGLLMVAVGGFWFIPATHIAQFWAFLLGVCFIASGLTFLETIANPYTTVLGAPARRGHPHQPGPILQRRRLDLRSDHRRRILLFQERRRPEYGEPDVIYPYLVIAVVVTRPGGRFFFANVPDIKAEDEYHLDDATPGVLRSIWTHPHFVLAVLATMYVAARRACSASSYLHDVGSP